MNYSIYLAVDFALVAIFAIAFIVLVPKIFKHFKSI